MSDKYIILDNHMRRVVDLDPEKVISPMTVEDLTSGEHTLQFGYPITGPGRNVRRVTAGREAWEQCELIDTVINEQGNVELVQELADPGQPAGEDVSREETGEDLGTGTLVDVEVVNGELILARYEQEACVVKDKGRAGTADSSDRSFGLSFKVNKTITVTRLGCRTISSYNSNYTVRLWRNSDEVQLASVTFLGVGETAYPWMYGDLSSPVTLVEGQSYSIAVDHPPSGGNVNSYLTTTDDSWFHPVISNVKGVRADGKGVFPATDDPYGRFYQLDFKFILHKEEGYKIWQPLDLSAAITAAGSLIEFSKVTPTDTNLKVYALLTDSDSVPAHDDSGWEEQTDSMALTVVAEDADMDGKRLWLMAVLETTDPSVTPSLSRWYALVEGQEYIAPTYQYVNSGYIVLPPLDISMANRIAKAAAKIGAALNGQTITPQLSLDGGETWGDYQFDYDTKAIGMEIVSRLKMETINPEMTPILESFEEDIFTVNDSAQLMGGHTVLIRDPDGDLQPFEIKENNLAIYGTKTRGVRCNHIFYELSDGPIRNYDLKNAVPSTAIAAALNGTRWELGNVDDSLISLTKDFQAVYLNPLEMLRLIEHTYEARLKFRVTVGGAGITGYYVDLLEIDNEFRGQRFEFGHNLQGIDLRVDDSRIKTALVGIGIGDEIDLETGEPLPLTFKGVEWSVANGDPCDKPLGQDWVGDEHARLQYGIYDPVSGEMLHRFGKYESQAETPEGLLWATWQQLQRYHVRPMVNVEAQVADLEQVKVVDIESGELTRLEHEKIRLGNVCYVKAEHKGLIAAVDAKIYRIERYLKKEEAGQTQLLLGDPILLGSDYIWGLEGKVDWKDKRRRQLDRGRGGQTVTVASEDTSLVPWYAKVVVKSGETVNDVWDEIMALLPDGGGQVLFLDGTYAFNGTLEITKNNVHISGQGESTIFRLADNVNSTVRGFMAVNKSGVKITDLAMNGNKENQTISSSNAVTLQYCKNFEIKSIIVKNFLASGILLWTCIDGIIETCQSIGNDNGINIARQQVSDEGCSNILVKGNMCIENESNGIRVNEGSDIVIEGNDCTRGWYGIVLINSSNNIIAVNNFQKCRLRGIELDSGSCENIITGNKIKQFDMEPTDTGVGIQLRMGSNRNTVCGNQCIGLPFEGISIYASDGNSISNNICTDCRHGIEVLGMYFLGPPEELTEALENEVIGNVCNCNRGSGGSYGGGIVVQWARKTQVQNNKCYHNNPNGIFIYHSHDTFVTNNDLFNNALGNLVDAGTNTETNPGNKTW